VALLCHRHRLAAVAAGCAAAAVLLVPAAQAAAVCTGSWQIGDVNGDHRPDIYVVQGRNGSGNAPDVLLVNDGAGTGFTAEPIPEAASGVGDTAYAIDYDRNGLTDFVVLNGLEDDSGPIQLIAFTRTP
jgi:FG-GAP-like repeat